MINKQFPSIWYGGDYNPDQWPDKILDRVYSEGIHVCLATPSAAQQ